MMVAQVLAGRASPPRRLFDLPPGGWEDSANRSQYAVFDNGRRFLVNVLVPVAAPQVLTVGQHWSAGLGAVR